MLRRVEVKDFAFIVQKIVQFINDMPANYRCVHMLDLKRSTDRRVSVVDFISCISLHKYTYFPMDNKTIDPTVC